MGESAGRPPARRETLETRPRRAGGPEARPKTPRHDAPSREHLDVKPRLLSDTNPTWLKAPLLLARFPGVLLSVIVAALILGIASVSSPLFVSSSGSAALQTYRAGFTGYDAGLTVTAYDPARGGFWKTQDDKLVGAVPPAHLEPRVLTMIGSTGTVRRAENPKRQTQVRLATRTGYQDHIQVLASAPGSGVWLTDTNAAKIKAKPGDMLVIMVRGRTTKVPIAGIYRDLISSSLPEFWKPLSSFILRENVDLEPPAPLMLIDQDEFLQIGVELRDLDQFRWEFPLRPDPITLPQAQAVAANISGVEAQIEDPVSSLGVLFRDSNHESFLPDIVSKSETTVVSLKGSVETMSLAGRIVALVVLAAVGIYGVQKRRVEMGLLSARGVSPISLGIRSAVEALIPAAAGAAAGWFAGVWLVKTLGPSSLIDASATRSAVWQVGWTTLVALALLAIVAGAASKSETVEGRSARVRGVVARTPWEIAVLALAAASYYEIVTRRSTTVSTASGPPQVDVLLLLFPILFVAGGAGLVTRLLRRYLPKIRAAGTRRSSPLYLASRRLAAASRMALLLVTASALSIGILVYAGTLVTSVSATANAKALVFSGSDVDAQLLPNARIPPHLPFSSTEVARIQGTSFLLPGKVDADILGIDPATFVHTAYWQDDFAGQSLQSLVGKLAPASGDARLPVILVGSGLPSEPTLGITTYRIPVDVVGRALAFPGMLPGVDLVVTGTGALQQALTRVRTSIIGLSGTRELWAKGDTVAVVRQMRAAGVGVQQFITAADVKSSPSLLSLTWTFGFLEALGVLAGLVVLVGLLLYLQARQRAREVSYALARRMGLGGGAHLASVALELTGMLAAAFVIGLVLSLAAARLVYGRLDPLPGLPPAPLLRYPLVLLALTAAGLLGSAWLGAWRVQRAADRANIAEVLRAAG